MIDVDGEVGTHGLGNVETKGEAIHRRMGRSEASGFEKALMALSGAAEGLAEQLRETKVSETAEDAIHKATDAFREVREGLRGPSNTVDDDGPLATNSLWGGATPEDSPSASGFSERPASRGVDATEASEGPGRTRRGIDRIARAARSVGDASARVARMPAEMGHDATMAAKQAARDLRAAGTGFGLSALFGLATFALVTWLVVGLLSLATGILWAVFLVGVIYAIITILLVGRARRDAALARDDVTRGLQQVAGGARRQARDVTARLRDAFRARRPTTGTIR